MSNKILMDLRKALANLAEVLALPKNPINRDAAIKRFELCFDLAWKAIKNYAKKEAVECYSPRECFRQAFQLKLIDESEKWLAMVDDRNLSAHLYGEATADQIYGSLKNYLAMFKQLSKKLDKE